MPTRACRGGVGLQASYGSDHVQPGTDGPLGVVFVGLRITEIDQHSVAHVPRNEAAEATYGLRDAVLIARNDLAKVLRVHPHR
jgi:hypothetical protein